MTGSLHPKYSHPMKPTHRAALPGTAGAVFASLVNPPGAHMIKKPNMIVIKGATTRHSADLHCPLTSLRESGELCDSP